MHNINQSKLHLFKNKLFSKKNLRGSYRATGKYSVTL